MVLGSIPVAVTIPEVTLNVAIIVKKKAMIRGYKRYQLPGTQGAFSNEVTSYIDGCTDEPVVQYDFQIKVNILWMIPNK